MKNKNSRWLSAAQRAQLTNLMAMKTESSVERYVHGPKKIALLYLDDSKNTATYNYTGTATSGRWQVSS